MRDSRPHDDAVAELLREDPAFADEYLSAALDVIGSGVKEIRIKDAEGIYRVLYVAKFDDAIYVLHCFKKKTETTAKHDKDIAETRYQAVIQKRKAKK